ncbi:MAG: arsenite methyltransferase [Desulfobacterales bacterium]|nr:arsenite methyltransferase [Desulfobacterales bacterium]
MEKQSSDSIRNTVRKYYGKVTEKNNPAPGWGSTCCGNGPGSFPVDTIGRTIGYSTEDLAAAPVGANLGLGCGNPHLLAGLKPGETVLDLGSGGGFDCFIAAKKVGETGRVIGVDMTPEMITKARRNAATVGATNVDFRLAEIERLPVEDGCIDIVISNCVINLSPDKPAVISEIFRVLKPGGRLAISDIVATTPLPPDVCSDPLLLCGCIGGAAAVDELSAILRKTGFTDIAIQPREESRRIIQEWFPDHKIAPYVAAATITAIKPSA